MQDLSTAQGPGQKRLGSTMARQESCPLQHWPYHVWLMASWGGRAGTCWWWRSHRATGPAHPCQTCPVRSSLPCPSRAPAQGLQLPLGGARQSSQRQWSAQRGGAQPGRQAAHGTGCPESEPKAGAVLFGSRSAGARLGTCLGQGHLLAILPPRSMDPGDPGLGRAFTGHIY